MLSFAKKMMKLPLSASLYGMKHLADLVVDAPMPQTSSELMRRFENQFVTFMRDALIAGDRLSEEKLDPFLYLLTQQGLGSGHVYKTGIDAVRVLAEGMRSRGQGSARELVWQEFGNKLQSFGTFRYVESALGIMRDDQVALAALIQQANTCDSYTRVWAIEGLGHLYAERVWQDGKVPCKLLTQDALAGLSTACLVALHAGMGLSFAKRCLKDVTNGNSDKEVESAVFRFVELCKENVHPGCGGVSLEALGLVVQTLYPSLRLVFDRVLHKCLPDLLPLYWHGVGRGAYFMPRSCLTWGPADWADLRGPHELGQLNLFAGLAWPVTLVNIRHPEVMAQFIARNGDFLDGNDAFATGVAASLVVWRHSTGGDAFLDNFCNYQPQSNNQTLKRRWREWVQIPSQIALSQVYTPMRNSLRFEDLFYYQSQENLLIHLQTT